MNTPIPSERVTGRALLMASAARLAARQGASSLVLREVARDAGLNHNSFYRHFDSMEAMMHAVVEDFGEQLRAGLSEARASLRPGDTPTPKVVGWLFDFANAHRDVFIVAMRECYGPAGPIRDSVRRLLQQVTVDMQRDLAMIGYLPEAEPDVLRRVLDVNVHEVFRYCIQYLEAPRRRRELLLASQELLEIMLAGVPTRKRARRRATKK